MSFYSEKVETYFKKLKRMDLSGFFSEDISFHEYIHLKVISILSKDNENGSVPISQLVENSGISPQAVSKLLRNMEEKDYILRYTSKTDRRVTIINLTDEGKRVFEITNNQVENVISKVFSAFTDEEVSSLVTLTDKFLNIYAETVNNLKSEDNTL